MKRETSVAMSATTESLIAEQLIRDDGQEDICIATYRPSSGASRFTALVRALIVPEDGDRFLHGNATITSDYILRATEIAMDDGCGIAFIHSHPGAANWQPMSGPDRECESSYANLVREITNLPLVGMTLATQDRAWSARHWDIGVGMAVDCTHTKNVRIVGDRLAISWNNSIAPPPRASGRQLRTVSAWGEKCQQDLARRKVLVVGAGSVGLDVILRLAGSGLCNLTLMDFDVVDGHNLDRLIGAARRDVRLKRPKVYVATREALKAATAQNCRIGSTDLSICEPDGIRLALDHDLIICCVDKPWPRAVANALAYSDLIPVIDGGIAIDTFDDGTMRNATWRSHVIRPGRPCMSCNGQLNLATVAVERQGMLEDSQYISGLPDQTIPGAQNVAPLSINVAASILAQYVSLSVAPGGIGDPGPLQYVLSAHELVHRDDATNERCAFEANEGVGDHRFELVGTHRAAEHKRSIATKIGLRIRLMRQIDDWLNSIASLLDSR